MKKLMRICLALALALTMAVPAFAAVVETYPIDSKAQAWINAHPEEVAEFLAGGIDDYLAETRPWYDSAAEMAEDWDCDEAYIRDFLLEQWACDALAVEAWNAWVADYEAAHPGIREQLEASAYDYFAQKYHWYSSPEEYMETYGLTQEEFIDWLVNGQLQALQEQEEHDKWLAEFEAGHPGVLAQLEANAYDYFAREYRYYSPEEFMEFWGLTEAEFIAKMVDEQITDMLSQEAWTEYINNAKTELGGVPGEIGVMLNDTYLTFPNAAPEAADGCIMAPCRVLMEALGGEAAFDEDSQTVSCVLGDTMLTLTLGESALTMTENGETTQVEMDCAAYAKDGRTYVPVRFVSQAFGYTVLWDDDYETAVLLDLPALAEEIDQNFTILNRVLANWQMTPGQTYEGKVNADLDMTIFDTLHGDEQYHFAVESGSLTLDGAGQGSVTLDVTDLLKLSGMSKEDILGNAQWYLDKEALAQLELLLDNLDQLSFEYIWNPETGELWLRSPLLGILDSSLTNAWLHIDAGDFFGGLLAELEYQLWYRFDISDLPSADYDGTLTVGALMCAAAAESARSPYHIDQVHFWDDTLSDAQEMAAVIGDRCFTHTSQGDEFTFERTDNYYQESLSVSLVVDDKGGLTGAVQYEEGSDWSWRAPYRVICEFDLGGGTLELSLNYHEKNSFQFQLDLTGAMSESDRVPLEAPPAGDAVVDLDDLSPW